MANKTLFNSIPGQMIPPADAINEAGGRAYALTPPHALAQYAATGCLSNTYYASAQMQLDEVLRQCALVEAEFIARTAIFCRTRGFMKDMPALLCAVLSVRDPALLERVFDRVIDNGRMLRNFVQIIRSGMVGRKSLGTLPKRLVRRWFEARTEEAIFRQSVGQSPSFGDILQMVHPKPSTPAREALYGYLIGREVQRERLPDLLQHYEAFKAGRSTEVPAVPFELLTALPLDRAAWTSIAQQAAWHTTRMNLNTFARHGVFEKPGMADVVAARLRDPELIARSRVFPYQLLAAYHAADSTVIPRAVRDALQEALEIAVANVPRISGQVYVCVDVSGSMSSPVTGHRQGATSSVRCVDVAALVAAAILHHNPAAEILPFDFDVVSLRLNPRDTVMTNAEKLASVGGGGTNCSAPLVNLNRRGAQGELVLFVSDSESWVETVLDPYSRNTETMRQWTEFKRRSPHARMACIDLQPNRTTQAPERADILNIGGFSDQVFEILAEFAAGRLNAAHWVGLIEAVEL